MVSAAVVGGGLGVDEQAIDLGGLEFECAFERGNDGVNARHRQVIEECSAKVRYARSKRIKMACTSFRRNER